FSWLVTLIVSRLLSPSDYGLLAMAGLPIGFLMLVGDLGVGPVVVQAPTLQRPQLQALFAVALWAYLLGAIVAFASAPVAAAFFAEPRLSSIGCVLSLTFVFSGLFVVAPALLR